MPTSATVAEASAVNLTQRWGALAVLHDRIDAHLERELQREHALSVREFSLLDVLSRQTPGDGGHLQMSQVADAVALSPSATTRLVTRLEDRGLLMRYLCPTDRRGIYTDVTPAGLALLDSARPTNERALRAALDEAKAVPELARLAGALDDERCGA